MKLLEASLPYSSTVLAHQTVGTLTSQKLNWQGNKKNNEIIRDHIMGITAVRPNQEWKE